MEIAVLELYIEIIFEDDCWGVGSWGGCLWAVFGDYFGDYIGDSSIARFVLGESSFGRTRRLYELAIPYCDLFIITYSSS